MKQIFEAINKAQQEFPVIKRNAVNPHFGSGYADLPSIWRVLFPLLAKNGLTVVQPVKGEVLETIVSHTSGEVLTSEYPLPHKDNPQHYAAQLTYARRYALTSLFCVQIEGEDDDGNTAASSPSKSDTHTATLATTDAPTCPKCGAPMRLRRGAKGEFYGCSQYPNCKATIDATEDKPF
jgi:hypothetical protein